MLKTKQSNICARSLSRLWLPNKLWQLHKLLCFGGPTNGLCACFQL